MKNNKRKKGIIIPMKLKENEAFDDLFDDINDDAIERNINLNDELLINSSHELKTPLNIIYSAAQMIDISIQGNNVEKVENYVDAIKNNCYRLTKYINHILDLNMIESGTYKLNLERVNIVEVLDYLVESIASKIKNKGLNIVFDTNVEERYVLVDSHLIGKSILNIISNAVKFSKSQGNIFIQFTEHKNNIEITVKDEGIGIDKEHFQKIFQRFGQIDKSLSRGSEGSGIGLKLAKAIIELHGGKVSVESKIDEGSIFKVKIPLNNKDTIYDLYKNDKIINLETIKEMVHIEFSDIFNIS